MARERRYPETVMLRLPEGTKARAAAAAESLLVEAPAFYREAIERTLAQLNIPLKPKPRKVKP